MDSKELLTKKRIESLAAKYENLELPKEELYDLGFENYDVFISYSSSDKHFIKKVLLFLKYSKGGVVGYVDWQDPFLPSVTNAKTAELLKKRINRAKKVIYVVTNESIKSVWCSWEIGFLNTKGSRKENAYTTEKSIHL